MLVLVLIMWAVVAGFAVAVARVLRRQSRGSLESRLDDLDLLLKAGRITPAEHAAARACALGIGESVAP